MKRSLNQVREFHEKFHVPMNDEPTLPVGKFITPEMVYPDGAEKPRTERQLRINLLVEEVEELFAAEKNNDLEEIADALADIIYIVLGTALAYGIPIHSVFEEVHRSNMSKDGRPESPTVNKITKGPSYVPPDIARAMNEDVACCEHEKQIKGLTKKIHDLEEDSFEFVAKIADQFATHIEDLIARCSICEAERRFLSYGESWLCSSCLKIRKEVNA